MVGKDVDVNDIVFTTEGGNIVAYIGVGYDLASPQGRSIYRAVYIGSSWTVAQDMNSGGTSTGTSITASIRSLALSTGGDTLLACGTDAGINHPIAYDKTRSGGLWTPFTTSGFPFAPGKTGKAVTAGPDTVYVAVDNEVYYLAAGATTWTQGFTYPNGTQIHFLFYDELLVGTGTGLYGHTGPAATTGLRERLPSQVLRVYPNPAQGRFRVEAPQPGSCHLRVFALTGQEVYSDSKLEVEGLRPGLYLAELHQAGQVWRARVRVE